MKPSIRELKHRYRVNTALDLVLPLADRGFPVPLSTGNPLFDAALTDKIQTSASLTEVEHLQRSWLLCVGASDDEIGLLAEHVDGLLNNFRLLLALACWDRGDLDTARLFIDHLPWHWRLAFPIAVLKPAAHFLTGWRRDTRFRLTHEARYPELRAVFSDLLNQAPEGTLLKFRSTVKEAAALQRYRFEGDKQQLIHDLCFNNARSTTQSTGVIATYVAARDASALGSVELAAALSQSEHFIPLTSLMGLFGNSNINLLDDRIPAIESLRDQVLHSATPVECLLRLREWSQWLTPGRVDLVCTKVTQAILRGAVHVPFFRVLAAFNALPLELRQQLVEPLLRPLMEDFGRNVADLLPAPGPITFVMPANVFRISSLLLYAVAGHITDARILLLDATGIAEDPQLTLDEIIENLAEDKDQQARWLLKRFGSRWVDRANRSYRYDVETLATVLDSLDPAAPVVLDLPFFANASLLTSLSRFDRVFNLGATLGAPGEIAISTHYYRTFSFTTPGLSYSGWHRNPDTAARSFTEMLDRLRWFERLGQHGNVSIPELAQ